MRRSIIGLTAAALLLGAAPPASEILATDRFDANFLNFPQAWTAGVGKGVRVVVVGGGTAGPDAAALVGKLAPGARVELAVMADFLGAGPLLPEKTAPKTAVSDVVLIMEMPSGEDLAAALRSAARERGVGGALRPDGAQHNVVIARYPLTPKLDYVTAPSLVQAVYRRAKVANTGPYTLVSGKANLFAGDDFLGATTLDLVPPQGEIELYLGVDDRIKVERELRRREVEKTLSGGKRRLPYGYEILLENLLGVEAQLTLYDQLPISRHEEIKVRLETIDPKPVEQTGLNLLKWEMSLPPGENRSIHFDFAVEFPRL